MQLVERHIRIGDKEIENICFKTARLYNFSIGKILNADINGAIGIARKVFGDSVVKLIIDSGLAFNPYKINIL